jgi:hypothetical protein
MRSVVAARLVSSYAKSIGLEQKVEGVGTRIVNLARNQRAVGVCLDMFTTLDIEIIEGNLWRPGEIVVERDLCIRIEINLQAVQVGLAMHR